ncbi:MAG TPA: NAD(+) synthase [Acidobacteriota bacterium]|nr:NAD(+) synthase [Acidobacteriota bacterium]
MKFRVSIAQINPKSGDLKGNALRILQAVRTAKEDGADLVVCPEMSLTGYCLDEKLLMNTQFLRENKRILTEELAPASQGIALVVGFVDFDESNLGPDDRPLRFNAAAVLQDGKLLQVIHKRLLPSYRYFDDKRYFQPGDEVEPVTIQAKGGEVSIGVLICEDLWDEPYALKPCRIYREKGTDYLLCINASPFVCSSPGEQDGKRFVREQLVRSQIKRHGIPIVWVNTVGIGDNGKNIIPFDGSSMAHDASGNLVAHLPLFQEAQQSVSFEGGRAPYVQPPLFDREKEIYEALVMSVRDYYEKIGIFEGVLEAVSGGIDSALGTAIAFEAMGPDLLTLFNLPSKYNSQQTQDAARQLAANLGVEYRVIPIQGIMNRIVADFESHLHPFRKPITLENLQARIRGLIMMAESNDRNALLLTNGNESEIALGYATLYGDMVGGIAVIGDLPKPDVYRVARYVNRRWGEERIPRESFEIPASAELKEDQTDPFDYEIVGPIISDYIEKGASPAELVREFEERRLKEGKYPENVYRSYDSASFGELASSLYLTMNRSVYKRVQAAPIVVVSERAFGFDLRESIINGWEG